MPDGDIPFGMSFSIRRFYMICKRVEIDTIPACVWGMASTRVIVRPVHGNMASKIGYGHGTSGGICRSGRMAGAQF